MYRFILGVAGAVSTHTWEYTLSLPRFTAVLVGREVSASKDSGCCEVSIRASGLFFRLWKWLGRDISHLWKR